MTEYADLRNTIDLALNDLADAERRICAARVRLRRPLSSPVPTLGLRMPLARLGDALSAIAAARRVLDAARPADDSEAGEEVQR